MLPSCVWATALPCCAALLRCPAVPLGCFGVILSYALPCFIEIGNEYLRLGIALLGWQEILTELGIGAIIRRICKKRQ